MGQTDNNGFYIKDDGTIVRTETSAKINQMKKKLSSSGDSSNTAIGNNDGSEVYNAGSNNSQNSNTSSRIEMITGMIAIICMIIGTIIGGSIGFSDSVVLGLFFAIVGFFVGAAVAGFIGDFIEKIFK